MVPRVVVARDPSRPTTATCRLFIFFVSAPSWPILRFQIEAKQLSRVKLLLPLKQLFCFSLFFLVFPPVTAVLDSARYHHLEKTHTNLVLAAGSSYEPLALWQDPPRLVASSPGKSDFSRSANGLDMSENLGAAAT